MVYALDVPADLFIKKVASILKEKYGDHVKPPAWAFYAKTGVHKEKPPTDPDWWYVRAASMLRKLYKANSPIGVKTFRTIYGGRKNRGSKPEHFYKGSGSVARKILQQLESAGLVRTVPGQGRVLSPEGRSLLDKVAKEIFEGLVKARPDLEIYK